MECHNHKFFVDKYTLLKQSTSHHGWWQWDVWRRNAAVGDGQYNITLFTIVFLFQVCSFLYTWGTDLREQCFLHGDLPIKARWKGRVSDAEVAYKIHSARSIGQTSRGTAEVLMRK